MSSGIQVNGVPVPGCICFTLPCEVSLKMGWSHSTGIHVSCRKSWRRLASCETLCQKC